MGFRYIGSKSTVIPFVLNKISEVAPEAKHVVDLMSGTATVSAALRNAGYAVTAVDVMTYSYHHGVVALLFSESPRFSGAVDFFETRKKSPPQLFQFSPYEKIIQALQGLTPKKGYFYKEFSPAGSPKNGVKPRIYFSEENASLIDAMRSKIKSLFADKMINALEHSLLLHDLIMAANDIANIAGTYGHYMSRLNGRANTRIFLRPTALVTTKDSKKHKVLKGYAEIVAKKLTADVCYIDPPYIKRQYAANYHVLETIAREDEPEAIGISGLRPWRDQYSDFCTKTKIREAFEKIFKEMKCNKFVISYSEDGLLSLNNLIKFMSEFGKVDVTKFSKTRFRSNNSSLGRNLTEYLIYLQKN